MLIFGCEDGVGGGSGGDDGSSSGSGGGGGGGISDNRVCKIIRTYEMHVAEF